MRRWIALCSMVALVAGLAAACVEPVVTGFAGRDVRATYAHAGGRIFVSVDDSVVVFAPDGSLVQRIDDVFGAGAIDADASGAVWVAETTAGRLVRIDPDSLTTTETAPLGRPVSGSLVAGDGVVWFASGGSVARYDVATDTAAVRWAGDSFDNVGVRLTEIPGAPDRILVNGTYAGLVVLDVSTDPARTVTSAFGSLSTVAVAGGGTKIVTGAGSPYTFRQLDLGTLQPDGVSYPGPSYANGVASSDALGGIVAGTTSYPNAITVSSFGIPVSTHQIQLPGEPRPNTVGVAADGSRVFAVVTRDTGFALAVYPLAPTVTAVAPGSVVAGAPATLTLTGTGLGRVSSATVGGIAATFTSRSATEVAVTVPAGVTPGTAEVRIETPFGQATTAVTVEANVGATLAGTVRSGSAPVSGVDLVLDGPQPGRTTTAADGTYAFAGLPFGTDYRVTVHDPSGRYADLALPGIAVTPNETKVLDVNLAAPPPATGAERARIPLPSTDVRKIVVDPGTGRVFVAVGDEVAVFDADGRPVARIQSQWGAQGLALGGSTLYVNLRSAGAISRIDTTTLSVLGTIATGRPTDGELAFAAGRLFFTGGNDQWVGLVGLDPATGETVSVPGNWYVPALGPVEGSTTQFVAWDRGLSPPSSYVVDATTLQVLNQANSWSVPGPVAASAGAGRAWTADGLERHLTDLTPTGVRYPTNGYSPVAYSPGHGGVLLFGRSIALVGRPQTVAELPVAPGAAAIDPAGDRVYYATADGYLVTWDLRPWVAGVTPTPTTAGGPVSVTGTGLARTTAVTLDGRPVAYSGAGLEGVAVTLPALTPGSHALVVRTPWGESAPFPLVVPDPPAAWTTTTTTVPTTTTTSAPTTTTTVGGPGTTTVVPTSPGSTSTQGRPVAPA